MNARALIKLAFLIPIVVWACQDQPQDLVGPEGLAPSFSACGTLPCGNGPGPTRDKKRPEINRPQPKKKVLVLNDCSLTFEAIDTRSLINNDGCTTSCTEIEANARSEAGGEEDLPVDDAGTDQLTNPDFSVNISVLADGEDYVVEIRVPDNALPEPNWATYRYSFYLDLTAPAFDPFTVFPPNEVFTEAVALQFTLMGSLFDPNLATATAGIFIDAPSGSGDCGFTNPLDLTPVPEGSGPGEVDDQSQDITDTASNYEANWLVQNTGITDGVVSYCFVVHAEDSAQFKDGTANPNMGSVSARTEVTWNPSSP